MDPVLLLVPCTASLAGKSRTAHKTQLRRRSTQSSLLARTALFHQMPPSAQQVVLRLCLGHRSKARQAAVRASLYLLLAACLLLTPWLLLRVR